MGKINTNDPLEKLLSEYCSIYKTKFKTGTLASFKTRIRKLNDIIKDQILDKSIIKWLEDSLKENDSLTYAMEQFECLTFPSPKVQASMKKDYKKLVLFALGQYDADLYMALTNKKTDEEFCRLVAQHAIFCTVDVAEKVKKGEVGSEINQQNIGNEYYSWFYCMFQRTNEKGQTRGNNVMNGNSQLSFDGQDVKYDDNTMANQAIKSAINTGLFLKLSGSNKKFSGYMACHIWDDSCHNNLFHTSVFNLVLLPKAIGGLSDYSNKVKELLQYEAAWRFGVYPEAYNKTDFAKKPKFYDDVDTLWRQPAQHEIAKDNIKKKAKPTPLT